MLSRTTALAFGLPLSTALHVIVCFELGGLRHERAVYPVTRHLVFHIRRAQSVSTGNSVNAVPIGWLPYLPAVNKEF